MNDPLVSYCGACAAIHEFEHARCPGCDSTLVVWRQEQKSQIDISVWWAVVNGVPDYSGRLQVHRVLGPGPALLNRRYHDILDFLPPRP